MKKNGFYWVERRPLSDDTWVPYKIWSSDLWECKGCGAKIISGHGIQPVSIDHAVGFEKLIERLNANQLEVDDC
jgi:hypothetical protein